MKTHGVENYIRRQIHELERFGIFEIATDSIRAWIDVFNEEEDKRMKDVNLLLKDFEASNRQYPDELFVPNKKKQMTLEVKYSDNRLYASQEVKLITNVLLQDILKEWTQGNFKIPLNKIIRERLK